jgi:hypothetical protein
MRLGLCGKSGVGRFDKKPQFSKTFNEIPEVCLYVLSFDAKRSHGSQDRALETQRARLEREFLGLKSGEAFHILSRSDEGGLNSNSSECM